MKFRTAFICSAILSIAVALPVNPKQEASGELSPTSATSPRSPIVYVRSDDSVSDDQDDIQSEHTEARELGIGRNLLRAEGPETEEVEASEYESSERGHAPRANQYERGRLDRRGTYGTGRRIYRADEHGFDRHVRRDGYGGNGRRVLRADEIEASS